MRMNNKSIRAKAMPFKPINLLDKHTHQQIKNKALNPPQNAKDYKICGEWNSIWPNTNYILPDRQNKVIYLFDNKKDFYKMYKKIYNLQTKCKMAFC